MMEYQYAIETLQREKYMIDKALNDTGKWYGYKESWKRQKNKSEQLGRAIKTLTL